MSAAPENQAAHAPEASATTTLAQEPTGGTDTPTAPGAARRSTTTDIALIATFAALTAVCSLLAIPAGVTGVPITLQTFGVLLAGAVLGSRRGALAILLYLAVGFAGLPIFAGGEGGVAAFASPSIGYLLAFPLAAWLVGSLVERFGRRGWVLGAGLIAAAGLAGSLLIYAIGIPVLAAKLAVALPVALGYNTAFFPGDLIKLVLAAIVAASVHRAFPHLLRRH
jgi:biotin transport system substrate-specific component